MDRKCIDFSLKYSPGYEFYFGKLQIARYRKLPDVKTDVEIRIRKAINVLEMLNKNRKMYLETNKNVFRYDI